MERIQTPLSKNLILQAFIEEHLHIVDLFQDGDFLIFLKFSYMKLFQNIKIPFLSKTIILESIIQLKKR